MATLHIRDIPDEVYAALVVRAQRERRSLNQQVIAELEQLPELKRREQRRALLGEILADIERNGERKLELAPEDLIREARDSR